jgi:ElaB/YqjD/DUF883 family membrane-anchored ribosome-binding protein
MTSNSNRNTNYGTAEREFDRAADKAQDAVDTARDKAQDTVESVRDKAQQVAGDVREQATRIGDEVASRADAATATVGEKMTDVAGVIRQKAPASGPIADAADTAADTLQRAGTYLQQQDLSDIRADVEGLIRRHPLESLLVGLGVGYLLARSMRR